MTHQFIFELNISPPLTVPEIFAGSANHRWLLPEAALRRRWGGSWARRGWNVGYDPYFSLVEHTF